MDRRHFVLRTAEPLHDIDRIRLAFSFSQWEKRGGMLLLPVGAELTEVGRESPPQLPEGVSSEGAAWAEEICDG